MSGWQLLGLLLWILFPAACGFVAFGKERSVGLWVVLGFLFGAFALVVIALLPEKNKWEYVERQAPLIAPVASTRPQTYGHCPKCGRIAFTADDDGDYYCFACGEHVQVA
jgi:hypothetical protein